MEWQSGAVPLYFSTKPFDVVNGMYKESFDISHTMGKNTTLLKISGEMYASVIAWIQQVLLLGQVALNLCMRIPDP